MPPLLVKWEFRGHSQNGEDGVIEHFIKMLDKVVTLDYRSVEVGFGHECNTLRLIIKGWHGLLIDANLLNVDWAQSSSFYNPARVRAVQSWVTVENLNKTIYDAGWGGDVDVLSIDVDGVDYWLWKSLTVIEPRIVVIEYNASLGPSQSLTIPYSPDFDRMKIEGSYHGASLKALTRLAHKKGYSLVGCESNGINAFFLKNGLLDDMVEPHVEEAFVQHSRRNGDWLSQWEKLRVFPWEAV